MSSLERNIVEQAYAFFHQKERVYAHSTSETERDHIEESISSYADSMSKELYLFLSHGRKAYLKEHPCFHSDLLDAISKMESLLRGQV